MKIVNDTEVYEPSECYFAISYNPEYCDGGVLVAITSMEYWNRNECLDDCFGDHSLAAEVQERLEDADIGSIMEATWSSNATGKDVREAMVSLGFVENEKMKEMLEQE